MNGFADPVEMAQRLLNLCNSYYDPHLKGRHAEGKEPTKATTKAEVACAQALYNAYFILHEKTYTSMVEESISNLQVNLLSYHAASLQVVLNGLNVLSRGRAKNARGPLHKLIQALITMYGIVDIKTLWSLLKEETINRTVMDPLTVEAVNDARNTVTFYLGTKPMKASINTIKNILSKVYDHMDYEPYEYFKALFFEERPAKFSAFWLRVKEEAQQRTIYFPSTKILSADDNELVYSYANEEFCIPKSVIQNKFSAFRKTHYEGITV